MKKFLQFTAVSYEMGDFLGYLLAWCSLIPQTLLVAQVTAFITAETLKRQRRVGSMLLGQVTNEILNKILKNLIRQPRPEGSENGDFGMPSSHSQYVGYFLIASLVLLPYKFEKAHGLEYILMWIIRISLVFMTALTVLSRVYLGYHDGPQVIVGLMLGLAFGLTWQKVHFMTIEGKVKL